jgi:hypothetical protein
MFALHFQAQDQAQKQTNRANGSRYVYKRYVNGPINYIPLMCVSDLSFHIYHQPNDFIDDDPS